MKTLKKIAWTVTCSSYGLMILLVRAFVLGRINFNNSEDMLSLSIFLGLVLGVVELGKKLHEKSDRC